LPTAKAIPLVATFRTQSKKKALRLRMTSGGNEKWCIRFQTFEQFLGGDECMLHEY